MNGGRLTLAMGKLPLSCGDIPDYLIDLIVLKFIKDAVRANQHVVQVIYSTLLKCSFWLASHNTLKSTKMCEFGLTVPKSAAN